MSQWLQRSERISSDRCGNTPRTSVAIQSRQKPSGTSFSVWQATTQSMQPTHLRVSMTIAKRDTVQASFTKVTKLLWMLVPPISGSVTYLVVSWAALAPFMYARVSILLVWPKP